MTAKLRWKHYLKKFQNQTNVGAVLGFLMAETIVGLIQVSKFTPVNKFKKRKNRRVYLRLDRLFPPISSLSTSSVSCSCFTCIC